MKTHFCKPNRHFFGSGVSRIERAAMIVGTALLVGLVIESHVLVVWSAYVLIALAIAIVLSWFVVSANPPHPGGEPLTDCDFQNLHLPAESVEFSAPPNTASTANKLPRAGSISPSTRALTASVRERRVVNAPDWPLQFGALLKMGGAIK